MAERAYISSPLGTLLVESDDRAVVRLSFTGKKGGPAPRGAVLKRLKLELGQYFAGRRRKFTLPVSPEGTPFQKSVWRAMRKIPYGATQGYGALARRIGRPKAVRAVGQACGANPVAIVVPCHRVIGADGSLGGFSSGLTRKKHLLALESHRL